MIIEDDNIMTSKHGFIFMTILLLTRAFIPLEASKYIDSLHKNGKNANGKIDNYHLKSQALNVREYHDFSIIQQTVDLRGGSIFAGWNPLGYGITNLGLEFLEFDGALSCDVGRFLASFKSGRKRYGMLKQQWLEIVRVSKQGQSMRIYRKLDELLSFCLNAGLIN